MHVLFDVTLFTVNILPLNVPPVQLTVGLLEEPEFGLTPVNEVLEPCSIVLEELPLPLTTVKLTVYFCFCKVTEHVSFLVILLIVSLLLFIVPSVQVVLAPLSIYPVLGVIINSLVQPCSAITLLGAVLPPVALIVTV